MPADSQTRGLERLIALVARLRAADGCPWDREQELTDLRAYLLEEAHEVAAAIDAGDWSEIGGELGDLLFQIAFVLRLGEEEGNASLRDVIARIEAKMISRHPHVFGDAEAGDAHAVRRAWERRKAREGDGSHLAGIPDSLPALLFAYRMTQKASGVGFDWTEVEGVMTKLHEEVEELEREIAMAPRDRDRIEDELGDALFTLANLGRHLGCDPEAALARANRKFRRRFERVERLLAAEGGSLERADPEILERLWRRVKAEESATG